MQKHPRQTEEKAKGGGVRSFPSRGLRFTPDCGGSPPVRLMNSRCTGVHRTGPRPSSHCWGRTLGALLCPGPLDHTARAPARPSLAERALASSPQPRAHPGLGEPQPMEAAPSAPPQPGELGSASCPSPRGLQPPAIILGGGGHPPRRRAWLPGEH